MGLTRGQSHWDHTHLLPEGNSGSWERDTDLLQSQPSRNRSSYIDQIFAHEKCQLIETQRKAVSKVRRFGCLSGLEVPADRTRIRSMH
jgi:hypothetical protein